MTMLPANNQDNALLGIIKAARIQGKDFLQIEQMYKIPAPQAEAILKEYYAGRAAALDPNEQRMLQLDRLEGLIDVFQQMATMGNIKSGEVLLKALDQISLLIGLNQQATKTEIRIVTEEQSEIVFHLVRATLNGILRDYITPLLEKHQEVLALVEDQWDDITATHWSQAVHEIVEAEPEPENNRGR